MQEVARKGAQESKHPFRLVLRSLPVLLILAQVLCLLGCAHMDPAGGRMAEETDSGVDGVGTKLYSTESGEGTPLLLIHGFGTSTDSWQYIERILASKNRVIAVDLKGFGRSPKPTDDGYSIIDQTTLIVDFIEEHKLKNLTIIGHSMGGAITLAAFQELQNRRIENTIDRLVLIDTAAYPQSYPRMLKVLRIPLISRFLVYGLPPRFQVGYAMKQVFYNDSEIPAELIDSYAQSLSSQGGKMALLKTARQIVPDDPESIRTGFSKVNVPVLIIWGRNDSVVPLQVGERLHRTIPNSFLEIIENCGHAPQEERPQETLEIIQSFLKRSDQDG